MKAFRFRETSDEYLKVILSQILEEYIE